MDGFIDAVTLDECRLFHGIDRDLYTVLVRDLSRNPSECLQIMGLWLWLERGGICSNFIGKVRRLDPTIINLLAEEALRCLNVINRQVPISAEDFHIPLTEFIVDAKIPFSRFSGKQETIFHQVQRFVSDVYLPALSDIVEFARHGGFNENSNHRQMMRVPGHRGASSSSSNPLRAPHSSEDSLVQSFQRLNVEADSPPPRPPPATARAIEAETYARTMFATFSKGYPVTEREVRNYFTTRLGNCIESLHMQQVNRGQQSLYAKIVFVAPWYISLILKGELRAKFTINGKHVWVRQFVPRNGMI